MGPLMSLRFRCAVQITTVYAMYVGAGKLEPAC